MNPNVYDGPSPDTVTAAFEPGAPVDVVTDNPNEFAAASALPAAVAADDADVAASPAFVVAVIAWPEAADSDPAAA